MKVSDTKPKRLIYRIVRVWGEEKSELVGSAYRVKGAALDQWASVGITSVPVAYM